MNSKRKLSIDGGLDSKLINNSESLSHIQKKNIYESLIMHEVNNAKDAFDILDYPW